MGRIGGGRERHEGNQKERLYYQFTAGSNRRGGKERAELEVNHDSQSGLRGINMRLYYVEIAQSIMAQIKPGIQNVKRGP